MITPEEKEEIIAAAVERTLLAIPNVIGSLIANHAALQELNVKFYGQYPEFRTNKDVVQAVVEELEGKNPLANYEDLLKQAVPEIRSRLKQMKGMNTDTVTKNVPRKYNFTDLPNGEL